MAGYRPEYTKQDDLKIINEILENEACLQVRGKVFWEELEARDVFTPTRTWQSLKDRYLKKIIPRLHLYKLEKKDYLELQEGYTASGQASKNLRSHVANYAKIKNGFTKQEDMAIINEIVNNDAYYNLRGTLFWKDLSRDTITQRTFESLKSRFHRYIFPNLEEYELEDEVEVSIRLGMAQTAQGSEESQPVKKKQRDKPTTSGSKRLSFDIEEVAHSSDTE